MGVFRNFLGSRRQFIPDAGKGITAMGVTGAAVDGGLTYYLDQVENPEHSEGYSMAKGALTGAAWLFAEPLMWGITLGQMAKSGAEMAYNDAKQNITSERTISAHTKQIGVDHNGNAVRGGTLGGNFQDNQQTATMRQRQMELLKRHRVSTESIMASEARQLHR